jgi:hypothetical protein
MPWLHLNREFRQRIGKDRGSSSQEENAVSPVHRSGAQLIQA